MKSIINNNKTVIKFLAIFLISYTTLYAGYSYFINTTNELDYFTKTVSNQTVDLLNLINYETTTVANEQNNFINLIVRNKNIAGIAEGCNAVSIMILFLAFIFSFAKNIKKTILFGITGLIIIHVMNISRIVILIVCMYHYPKYSSALHDYVFPATIYGVVFLLWMYWVNSFEKKQ